MEQLRMQWIFRYQLFLFDLDGLLVNTEEQHFQAYKIMLERRGFTLPWDFMTYFRIAQTDADAPRRYVYAEFPELFKKESRWDVLYSEKKKAYLELLEATPAPLMPGASRLLLALASANIKRCVVTHSHASLVQALKRQNAVLDTIPMWFTREDYKEPKPAPDGYLKAISTLALPEDNVIGFEDSSRGMRALLQTRSLSVLVNAIDEPTRLQFKEQGYPTFKTLDEVIDTF